MNQAIQNNRLVLPLYHGTSTLFLSSIVEHGLAGVNPLQDWRVLELAQEVLELSQSHLKNSEIYSRRGDSFRRMTEQIAGVTNWQHGDTYVSTQKQVAIRYAANKRFGSELLTYTLDFLEELLRHEVPGVGDDLFKRFRQVFRILDLSCSPILIEANEVPVSGIVGEDGSEASLSQSLRRLDDALQKNSNQQEISEAMCENFRLRQAIPVDALRIWLMHVTRWHRIVPQVTLYEIKIR